MVLFYLCVLSESFMSMAPSICLLWSVHYNCSLHDYLFLICSHSFHSSSALWLWLHAQLTVLPLSFELDFGIWSPLSDSWLVLKRVFKWSLQLQMTSLSFFSMDSTPVSVGSIAPLLGHGALPQPKPLNLHECFSSIVLLY